MHCIAGEQWHAALTQCSTSSLPLTVQAGLMHVASVQGAVRVADTPVLTTISVPEHPPTWTLLPPETCTAASLIGPTLMRPTLVTPVARDSCLYQLIDAPTPHTSLCRRHLSRTRRTKRLFGNALC